MRIVAGSRPPFYLLPMLRHRISLDSSVGFANPEGRHQGVEHTFDVYLDENDLLADFVVATEEMDGVDLGGPLRKWQWAALEEWVSPEMQKDYDKGEVVLARLSVVEYPAFLLPEFRHGWFVWLDELDGEAALVGEAADEVFRKSSSNFTLPFTDGSLFFLVRLESHPLLAGQQVGARLLCDSLWRLARATGDVAILLASPSERLLSPTPADKRLSALRRLVRFYEDLGFERVWPRRPMREGAPVAMYSLFTGGGLRAYGIGNCGLEEPELDDPGGDKENSGEA